jgi:hypothetical protein
MVDMGISDRRAKRGLKHPVRGTLRITGLREERPPRVRVTGVISAPGMPDATVEHKADDGGRWAGAHLLPVIVDRSDPSRFVVLWEEAQAGLPVQREPRWPLSPRMAAKFEEWFGPESEYVGDEEIAVGLREAMLETLEEMGPGALTAEGWRVFAPVEEGGGSSTFPQVPWPEGRVPPGNTGAPDPQS